MRRVVGRGLFPSLFLVHPFPYLLCHFLSDRCIPLGHIRARAEGDASGLSPLVGGRWGSGCVFHSSLGRLRQSSECTKRKSFRRDELHAH